MPTTYAIPDGRTVMAATLYTGNSATQNLSNAVNGVSFQPDFVWIKDRTNAVNHQLYDSVRGVSINLHSNTSGSETTTTGFGVTAFASNGPTIVDSAANYGVNYASDAYVAWQWKAGGTAVTNTTGTITTTVSANPTAGFSVMTYTGTGIDNKTIGHGLNSAPQFLIWKPRNASTDWMVWHIGLSGYNYDVRLNTTAAQGTGANPLNSTAPSSTVITLRNQGDVNGSGVPIVCYAFAAVAGYSAFGSYTGNGSADGPFVFTNFQPRWLMVKRTDTAGFDWVIIDTARDPVNVMGNDLYANSSSAEVAGVNRYDFLSNGFKVRTVGNNFNASGGTYIYASFASNPFKYANAR
jgi:hypothetical protein